MERHFLAASVAAALMPAAILNHAIDEHQPKCLAVPATVSALDSCREPHASPHTERPHRLEPVDVGSGSVGEMTPSLRDQAANFFAHQYQAICKPFVYGEQQPRNSILLDNPPAPTPAVSSRCGEHVPVDDIEESDELLLVDELTPGQIMATPAQFPAAYFQPETFVKPWRGSPLITTLAPGGST